MRWFPPAHKGAARALAFVVVAGLAGGPLANHASAQTQADFVARMDADGDRRVSLGEYTEHLSYAFRRMDVDGNSVLESNEQRVPNAKRLTLVEHHANLTAMFRKQDTNHDGYLSARELAAPPPR